ncbi:type I glyceraldehyde-3-phosphate dehydrogenase [Patescibacteria group bacterium]
MIKVAINGFGRIGRTALKAGWDRKGVKFVAINDLTEPAILAQLLKHDSVFGGWKQKISSGKNYLMINNQKIPVVAQKDPSKLPWSKYKVDVVIEATGRFTNLKDAQAHLKAGAKRVVISAPAKEVPTYLMGVNHKERQVAETVVDNASCTTNSIAPVAKIVEDAFGIQKAMMTTIHSVTAAQNLVDGLPRPPKNDLRRARSAMVNIVPTTTGAAKATTQVIPSLKDKFDGIAVRVPVLDVSLSDFTFLLKQKVTEKQINDLFIKAAKSARWKGILGVTDEPVVSSDLIRTSYSSVVDLGMTRVVDGDLVKVMAWYDNEWGYSVRLIDMVQNVGKM